MGKTVTHMIPVTRVHACFLWALAPVPVDSQGPFTGCLQMHRIHRRISESNGKQFDFGKRRGLNEIVRCVFCSAAHYRQKYTALKGRRSWKK